MKKVKNIFDKIREYIFENKVLSVFVTLILILGVVSMPRIFAELQPVKSVEIFSEKLDYKEKKPGAWRVDKSAKWISKGVAEITFDVSSVTDTDYKYTDVLFVLDISGSMEGNKLKQVKVDSIELINSLLSDGNNRAGLISFDSRATIVSELTSDKDELVEKITSLSTSGCTNYYQALVNVDSILKNYRKENDREIVILFLTDGYPNEETPNEEGLFSFLKNQYPFITINGVQYEMGNTVLEPLKKVSDSQYLANMETLNNVLFEASKVAKSYDNFELTDYIDTDNFVVDDENDIKANRGSISFNKENQKITWNIGNFISGSNAKLTINAKLKEKLIGNGEFYSTNKKEKVKSEINFLKEDVESSDTPILYDNYKVIYDGNVPFGCRVDDVPKENGYSVFDTVKIDDASLKCDGYKFKGWEIVTDNVKKINDDYFLMPEKDVLLRAVWSKLEISKTMKGTVRSNASFYDLVARDYNDETKMLKKYMGDTSTFKGKNQVYYYSGLAENNNVLFANYCWKIVRTTDTGGVKLLYNGVPDEDMKCNNTGVSSQLTAEQMGTSSNYSSYNDDFFHLSSAGYMYNTKYDTYSMNFENNYVIGSYRNISSSTSYYFADGYKYDGSVYHLNEPLSYVWRDDYTNLIGKYTCLSSSSLGTCNELAYIFDGNYNTMYYKSLSAGEEYSDTLTFGDSVSENLDGTFTLNNPIVFTRKEWLKSYKNYEHYYTCGDNSLTCETMGYIVNVSSYSFRYIDRGNVYRIGNSFKYDNGVYTLVDTKDLWDVSLSDNFDRRHYTCFNESGVCSTIYYVFYGSTSQMLFQLSGGKNIEDSINEMLYNDDVNRYDSPLKEVVDYWFANNMIQYEEYLEDTVWCNDRSVYDVNDNPFNSNSNNYGQFRFNSSYDDSDLSCKNKNDRFTVSKNNGNGALTYPVGLLSMPEFVLSYSNGTSLCSNSYFWSMTPANYYSSMLYAYYLIGSSKNIGGSINSEFSAGVRPTISLNSSTTYVGGDGSVDSPYVIFTSS